jgi:hypothetical protein
METRFKNFTQEATIIQEIENWHSLSIRIVGMPGKVHLSKAKREFTLSYDGLFEYPTNKRVSLEISGAIYEATSNDFDLGFASPFVDVPSLHSFDVDGLYRGTLQDKTMFRMFFFNTSKRQNLFHFKLEKPKHDGVTPWAFDCVRLDLKTARYEISQYKHCDVDYIVIENLDPVSLINFKAESYAIQKGIGFLCGYMPGGEHYIFSGIDFQYSRLAREALKSNYHPVTSNPFSFTLLHKHRNTAQEYEKKLSVIPSATASELIRQMVDNEDFAVAILFLMEVTHSKSVVSMPGVFSVILESFANIIINPQKVISQLITNSVAGKQLMEDLNSVLDRHVASIQPAALKKIRRRLPSLIRPINPDRLTNFEKLREPFDQLGIHLSHADEAAIESRNSLLHGNILMNEGQARSSREIDDHMLYITAKLYTLISKLILKKCGYNGYVINQVKFYDYPHADKEPDFFELI